MRPTAGTAQRVQSHRHVLHKSIRTISAAKALGHCLQMPGEDGRQGEKSGRAPGSPRCAARAGRPAQKSDKGPWRGRLCGAVCRRAVRGDGGLWLMHVASKARENRGCSGADWTKRVRQFPTKEKGQREPSQETHQ